MKHIIFIVALGIFLFKGISGQESDPDRILNRAIYIEEVDGNIEEAIKLYEEIIKDYQENRFLVAQALYRNGLANEKLGTQKAREYYEKILTTYTEQSEMVRLAQQRIQKLNSFEKKESDIKGLLWLNEDRNDLYSINLYGEEASITKGTMLENSSLSPDGNLLVGIDYSIGQNIALYDLRTKQINLITKYDWNKHGNTYTYYPVWSPDGKEVAYLYTSEDMYNIKISSLNGDDKTLLKNSALKEQYIPRQWSADGKSILTFKRDSTGLYSIGLIPAAGGNFKELYTTKWQGPSQEGVLPEGDATFSPDGKHIAFSDGQNENLDLYIIDTNGNNLTLLSGFPGSDYNPLWSPDGKHILFFRKSGSDVLLYTQEIIDKKPYRQPLLIKDGMQNVKLKNWTNAGVLFNRSFDLFDVYRIQISQELNTSSDNLRPLEYSRTGSNIQPKWSHDGNYISFISFGLNPELVVFPLDGSDPDYFPIEAPEFWENSMFDLNWLPDNSGISFSILNSNNKPKVLKLDLNTKTWQSWILPVDGWSRIAWGPALNSFVYAKHGDSDDAGIYEFNTLTGNSKKILTPETEDNLCVFYRIAFSHDYKKLACDVTGNKFIILDIETGGTKYLSGYSLYTLSPDGEKLLVRSNSGFEILSVEKGDVLNNLNLNEYFPDDLSIRSIDWSPSGNELIVNTRNSVYQSELLRNVLKDK